ncbi:hypothetical protein ACFRAR_36960 [Kitasatospora sp. NPDC056651]|uniref:hypothetical protein n=1 Tax=Kitasatospora sp. NPDC056651 TaxID=3345892 RepID=UPI003683EB8C
MPAASRGFDGAKKTNGRKRHVIVDCLGLLLMVLVTPADATDRDAACGMPFQVVRSCWRNPDLVHDGLEPGAVGALPRRDDQGRRPAAALRAQVDLGGSTASGPSGLALRFAQVVRYRPDKSPAEADTVASVRELGPAKCRRSKRIVPQWGFTHRGRTSHSRSGHPTPPSTERRRLG